MQAIQYKMDSPLGSLYLVAGQEGLRGIFWSPQAIRLIKSLSQAQPQEKIIISTVKQLQEYFAGERKKFNVALDFIGTSFQRSVWRQLAKIPYGKKASYKQIAQRINNPKAVRAVGTANGKNPFCIIVPCHRVIAADGSIGGYAGGIKNKEKLLHLEQQKNLA